MKYRNQAMLLLAVWFFSAFSAQAEVFDGIGKTFKHPPMNSAAGEGATQMEQSAPMMQPEGPVLQGKVLEISNGAGYSYLLLEAGGQKFWIAGTQVTAKQGDVVSYIENVIMENFTSKTLNKTFDRIVFASSVHVVP